MRQKRAEFPESHGRLRTASQSTSDCDGCEQEVNFYGIKLLEI